MNIPLRVAVTRNTILVIEDQATKLSYDSEPYPNGNRARHTLRVWCSHSSDCWSVVPKMRREGHPDPRISLSDQSAVLNKVQDPRQIRVPSRTCIGTTL
jgi:hypothetical protein